MPSGHTFRNKTPLFIFSWRENRVIQGVLLQWGYFFFNSLVNTSLMDSWMGVTAGTVQYTHVGAMCPARSSWAWCLRDSVVPQWHLNRCVLNPPVQLRLWCLQESWCELALTSADMLKRHREESWASATRASSHLHKRSQHIRCSEDSFRLHRTSKAWGLARVCVQIARIQTSHQFYADPNILN